MGMGKHTTFVNGHRGEDGSADAPVIWPLVIPDTWPRGPVSTLPRNGHDNTVPPDKDKDSSGKERQAARWVRAAAAHRGWLAAVPIVLVNAVAFSGQLAFLRVHLPWSLAGQVLVAVTLESVAVYLAWQAHLALAADDSAMRLRLAAYGFAAVIGVMNYSHWMAAGWRPTFEAVTFALMSVSSPWLWSVHSRRVSRDVLKAKGLIEPHAVRLGGTRWAWHPWRCVRVMSRATWAGVNDPVKAVALPAAKTPGDGRAGTVPVAAVADKAPDVDKAPDKPASPVVDKPQVTPKVSTRPVTALDRAADIIKRNPGMTNAEVAKRARVHPKTVQRARSKT